MYEGIYIYEGEGEFKLRLYCKNYNSLPDRIQQETH